MANMVKLQMGKNGYTPEFLENLKLIFSNKDTESVRVGLLKTSSRDKEQAKGWAEEIIASLGPNYTYKIIGYTITLRKWRKARVKKEE